MEHSELIIGKMSPSGYQIWPTLIPGILLAVYFVGGILLYAIRWTWIGPYADEELEKRDRTPLTCLWLRLCFLWVTRPIWLFFWKCGIPATAVTTLSFLLSLVSGTALAFGAFSLGGWLFIFSGICDFVDGRLARAAGEARSRGSLLDSALDRYSDAVVFMGLAWYFRETWVLVPVLVGLVGAQLVSYVRAKGESLGTRINVGWMQRGERILFLGAGLALNPIADTLLVPTGVTPPHRVAIAAIVLLAITTQMTALRRLLYGLRALGSVPLWDWFSRQRGSFIRNFVSTFVATAVDLTAVLLLVERMGQPVGLATALGCILGAIVNFTVNRLWTFAGFGATQSSPILQAMRYGFVATTSTILNSGGVMVLMLVPSIPYPLAWLLVRIAVFVTWNLPLHRDYVFRVRFPGQANG